MLQKLFTSWNDIVKYREVFRFALSLSKSKETIMDFIYTNLIQYVTEQSELPKYLLDSEVPHLTYIFAEISDKLTFDPIHNKYINYTTAIWNFFDTTARWDLFDIHVNPAVPQTIHIPSRLYVFGPGVNYNRIQYCIPESLNITGPICTCVASLDSDDFEGFLDLLTTINKYQALYFSYLDMKIPTVKLHRKLSYFVSPTLERTRAAEFLDLIKISKSARCFKIDMLPQTEKTDNSFVHLAAQLLDCDKLEILHIPHITRLFYAAVAAMKSLRELRCSTVDLHAFNTLLPEGLESLHIGTVTDNSVEIAQSLKRLTSLRHVNIYFSHANDETIVALMTSLSHCHKILTLRFNSKTQDSSGLPEAVSHLFPGPPHPGFPLLKVLSITNFGGKAISYPVWKDFRGKLPKLESLNFDGNELGNTMDDFYCSESHPTFPSLKTLGLSNAKLTATDVLGLGAAIRNGNFPKLETLDLRYNDFATCKAEVETLIKNCTEKPQQPALTLNLLDTKVKPGFRSKILDTYASQSAHTHVIIYI